MHLFSLLTGKKNIFQTGLLDGMTDVHCHLLPGVDDGVQTQEEAQASLLYLQEKGVKRFILTPHVMDEMPQNNRVNLLKRFEQFKTTVPDGIEVKLAAEYMLDAAFIGRIEEGILAINRQHVLVETSYLSAPPEMKVLLYELTIRGYTPVIAHPERYLYMQKEGYAALKEKGYQLQLNLLSLAGFYGGRAYENSHYLLKCGLYDYVGSDFHNLEKHKRGLDALSLTSSNRKELQRIMEKNKELW